MQEVRIFRFAGNEFEQSGLHAKLHGMQFFFSEFFLTSWKPSVMLSRSFGDRVSAEAVIDYSEEKTEGWLAFR